VALVDEVDAILAVDAQRQAALVGQRWCRRMLDGQPPYAGWRGLLPAGSCVLDAGGRQLQPRRGGGGAVGRLEQAESDEDLDEVTRRVVLEAADRLDGRTVSPPSPVRCSA
jgi:hypothetical protein